MQRKSKSVKFGPSYQHLLICLIGPGGSDKYSPGDLELLLWISMLIGFRLDLTDPASPRRGTASSQGEGFCMGVSRGKEGGEAREKGKRVKKGRTAGWMVGEGGSSWRRFGEVWKILPISMWKKKGSDSESNPVMINMVT